MDIVAALSRYRKSIVDSDTVFFMLNIIFKDGEKTEKDLEEALDLSSGKIKIIVRELYQASLLRINKRGNLSLTPFAEGALINLGADKLVAPHLIDEIVRSSSASHIHMFFNLVTNTNPRRSDNISRSLRNLKNYTEFRSFHESKRISFAISCIITSVPSVQSLMQKELISKNEFLFFSGHGAIDNKSWSSFMHDYKLAIEDYEDSNLILMNACRPSRAELVISDEMGEYLAFRTYNYLLNKEHDYIFESCVPRMRPKKSQYFWAAVWEKIRKAWVFASADLEESAQKVKSPKEMETFAHYIVGLKNEMSAKSDAQLLDEKLLMIENRPPGRDD